MHELTLQENWGPNLMYREGIVAHNQGRSRDSSPVQDPRAVVCFQRGWDAVFETK